MWKIESTILHIAALRKDLLAHQSQSTYNQTNQIASFMKRSKSSREARRELTTPSIKVLVPNASKCINQRKGHLDQGWHKPSGGIITELSSDAQKRKKFLSFTKEGLEGIKGISKQLNLILSKLQNDLHFKRLHYVKHADDFVLGVTGSKLEETENLEKVRRFLKDELKLKLSEDEDRC